MIPASGVSFPGGVGKSDSCIDVVIFDDVILPVFGRRPLNFGTTAAIEIALGLVLARQAEVVLVGVLLPGRCLAKLVA